MDIRRGSLPENISGGQGGQGNSDLPASVPNDNMLDRSANNNNRSGFWDYLPITTDHFSMATPDDSDIDGEFPASLDPTLIQNETSVCFYTNRIKRLPEDIFNKCSNLRELRLTRYLFKRGVGLRTIPTISLSGLKTLKILDLRGNPLKHISFGITQLEQLEELNLENCQIEELTNQLSNLKCLKRLELDNNKIKKPTFENLPSDIEYLSISNNGITEITHIKSTRLNVLNLSENFLTKLPDDFFEDHGSLKRLYLRDNSFELLPSSIATLKNLMIFDISKNILKRLPPKIGQLDSLKYLNISVNDISILPESVVGLKSIDVFLCGENPLQKPPLEIASRGLSATEDYFKALKISQEIRNKRMKIIILGDKDAGEISCASLFGRFKHLKNYYEIIIKEVPYFL